MLDKAHIWKSGKIGTLTLITTYDKKTGVREVKVDTPLPQFVTFEASFLDSHPIVAFDRKSGLARFVFDNGVANFYAVDQRGTTILMKLLNWVEREKTVETDYIPDSKAPDWLISEIRKVVQDELRKILQPIFPSLFI